jgi:DNA-binding MarR family transcriptional regulator
MKMARTRKIDELDQIILDLMGGKIRDTNVRKWWSDEDKKTGYRKYYANGCSIETIADTLREATGDKVKLPTVRYHIGKLVDMGYIKRTGNAGWGRSYNFSLVTDEEKAEKLFQKHLTERRNAFGEELTAMLAAVGITREDGFRVDRWGDVEIKATDLAKLLQENYTFETEVVYEDADD